MPTVLDDQPLTETWVEKIKSGAYWAPIALILLASQRESSSMTLSNRSAQEKSSMFVCCVECLRFESTRSRGLRKLAQELPIKERKGPVEGVELLGGVVVSLGRLGVVSPACPYLRRGSNPRPSGFEPCGLKSRTHGQLCFSDGFIVSSSSSIFN
jgi:hypothetical protein